jgi:hypothetical protein
MLEVVVVSFVAVSVGRVEVGRVAEEEERAASVSLFCNLKERLLPCTGGGIVFTIGESFFSLVSLVSAEKSTGREKEIRRRSLPSLISS